MNRILALLLPVAMCLVTFAPTGAHAQVSGRVAGRGVPAELPNRAIMAEVPPVNWEVPIAPDMAAAPVHGFFARRLYGIQRVGEGAEALVLSVNESGTTGTLRRIPLAGYPADHEPRSLAFQPESSSFYLLALPMRAGNPPALLRAPITADGTPGPLEALALPKGALTMRAEHVIAHESVVGLLAREAEGSTPETRLFLSAWTGRKLADWVDGPSMPRAREGAATFVVGGNLYLFGGREYGQPDKMPPEVFGRFAPLTYPNPGTWSSTRSPLMRTIGRATGTSTPSAAFLLPETPMPGRADAATSLSIAIGGATGASGALAWRETAFAHPRIEGARLVNAPSDYQILLIGGRLADGTPNLRLAGIAYPPDFALRRPTEAEEVAQELQKVKLEVSARMNRDRALAEARRTNRYLLCVIPGDDRDAMRAITLLRESQPLRTLTSNVVTYFAFDAEGASLASKFGVGRTPAFVLHTADDQVYRRFTGVPSLADFTRLTEPTRLAAGDAKPE